MIPSVIKTESLPVWFVLPTDKVSRILFHISFLYLIFVDILKQIPYEDCKIDNL
jgi:hypothetical protein